MRTSFVALSFLLMISPLLAAEGAPVTQDTLATDSVPKLFRWFDDLVSEYDGFIEKEKKKQFLRRLSRLNDALFKLQRRKEEFLAELEVKAPRYASQELSLEMRDSFEDLRRQYERVRELVDSLGGMVSQSVRSGGVAISQSLANAASERRKGIDEIAQEFKDGRIDLQRVRALGQSGISAIKTAIEKLSKVIQDLEKKG